MRTDQRKPNELRQIKIVPNALPYAEGSALIEFGQTRVLCSASVETQLPKWLSGRDQGWVTAEYGMLPRSTHTRISREKAGSSGRTQEISRLIGRALRAAVNLKALGPIQIIVDCDVLQADGGTRTASVTGGFVALALAIQKLKVAGLVQSVPLRDYVAAVSVGIKGEELMLDLCYEEDSSAETDMNIIMTGKGAFIEVQGTAEGQPFSPEQLRRMTELATMGCKNLFAKQSEVIGSFFPWNK